MYIKVSPVGKFMFLFFFQCQESMQYHIEVCSFYWRLYGGKRTVVQCCYVLSRLADLGSAKEAIDLHQSGFFLLRRRLCHKVLFIDVLQPLK